MISIPTFSSPLQATSLYLDVIFQTGIPMLIGIMALIGCVMVLMTRPDAFDAADRKPKGTWAAMLGISAVFLIIPPLSWLLFGIPMIVGCVLTGVYWLDVRPQIKDILSNAQGW